MGKTLFKSLAIVASLIFLLAVCSFAISQTSASRSPQGAAKPQSILVYSAKGLTDEEAKLLESMFGQEETVEQEVPAQPVEQIESGFQVLLLVSLLFQLIIIN